MPPINTPLHCHKSQTPTLGDWRRLWTTSFSTMRLMVASTHPSTPITASPSAPSPRLTSRCVVDRRTSDSGSTWTGMHSGNLCWTPSCVTAPKNSRLCRLQPFSICTTEPCAESLTNISQSKTFLSRIDHWRRGMTTTAGMQNKKSGCARGGTGELARKLTAWRGSDRWSESEICWNKKRNGTGTAKSPRTPEIQRNCGRCSMTFNGRIVPPLHRRPTSPQRRCRDSSRTKSGQCATILPQQMHRPSPIWRTHPSPPSSPALWRRFGNSSLGLRRSPVHWTPCPRSSYTGVPRRVAPVHLHHVQRLLATWSAPWITERSYRHSDPQETRSWSGRCQELSSDLKLDIHFQGHRTDRCLTTDGLPSDEQAPSGPPISLQTGAFHGDGSSQDFLWHPGRCWLGSGDAARITRHECSLRHCRPRHPPDKATQVVRCRWNSTRMDFIIHPRSTAISHFQRPSIRTDSAEIRRATGISLGTAPLHPVYLRCHLHCRFTWCRSSLLCRRQPTLPPLPSRRPTVCRSQIDWVHRKSRGLDEVESAEAEPRQDSIHVAWIQTAVGEDRHKDHNDRWTLHRILDFRQESRRDIRQWTGNGPACQQHHPQLFLSVETAEIHPTITFHGCRENIGLFPHNHVVSITVTVSFTVPQTLSWEDCNLSSTPQPGWSRTGGSSTILLLCWGISSTGFPSVSVSISRSQSLFTTPFMAVVRHTSAALAIRSERSAPGLICDLLFEATWLCLEPGLVAMGPEVSVSPDRWFGTHCPRTLEFPNCRWNVSNLSWKHIYFAMHMPSSAHSAFVTWLRSA